MKTFILYTSNNEKSVENANSCLNSFTEFKSWKPELFDGCTPEKLDFYQNKYMLKNDRSRYKPGDDLFKSKKSCFYSHFDLWLKCVEFNKPIAIMEHDVYCVRDLPENFSFKSVIHFAAESIYKTNLFPQNKHSIKIYKMLGTGLHSIKKFPPLKKWGHCMPGNMAYAITPSSAKTLIEDCFKNGWQQNDILMSEKLLNIEIMVPSIINYDPEKEIHSSSLKNM